MKLLFTQDAIVNAGAERSHLEILSRFSNEVDVVFVYFYPKHDLKEEYEKAGIQLIFLDIPESYHFITAISCLVKYIRIEKPDLLVSSLWRADQITRIASLITAVPLVGTLVNDSYAPLAWKDKKGLKYKGVYWLDKLTAGIPKHWIANAEALAESHVRTLGLDAEKISVVYRGRIVPEQKWRKEGLGNGDLGNSVNQLISKSVNLDNKGLGIRDLGEGIERIKPYSFISYGRLLERKGFQDAIQAFSTVIKKYPNCTLTIFGEGPFRIEMEKLVQNLGLENSIFLPGKLSNPIEALISGYCPLPTDDCQLMTAHCFLFPSWYEGFSGALVEAMMAGIPIIASDISMNLEAISPENALIFEVQNTDKLASQMIFAIQHPDIMAGLGAKAREEAIARFDIEKIANLYEQTILTVYQAISNET